MSLDTMTAKEMKRFESLCRCHGQRKPSAAQLDWLKESAKRYDAAITAANQLFYIYQMTADTDGRGFKVYTPSIVRFVGTRKQANAAALKRNEANLDGDDMWLVSNRHPTP